MKTFIFFILCIFFCIIPLASATYVLDVGIEGDSQIKGYEDKIMVESFQVTQDEKTFTIVKTVDRATPELFSVMTSGEILDKAILVQITKDDSQEAYTFLDVALVSFTQYISESDVGFETVVFSYDSLIMGAEPTLEAMVAIEAVEALEILPVCEGTAGEAMCKKITSDYEESGEFTIPSGVPYKNEILNLKTLSDETVGSVIITDGSVQSITCCQLAESPTYIVKIKDIQTLDDIGNTNKTVEILDDKIGHGDIEIYAVSVVDKVKFFFAKIFLKIASWF